MSGYVIAQVKVQTGSSEKNATVKMEINLGVLPWK